MTGRRSTWILAAALVALTLVGLAWTLLLSPGMSRIAELREERESTQAQNDLLGNQIAALAAADVDELRAELDTLRAQIPTAAELPEFTRGLDRIASESGATVRVVTVGSPQPVTEFPELPPAPDGTPAPTVPAPAAGLYAVPISLSIEGTFEQAQQYATRLQSGEQRLFLVSRLSWTAADADGRSTFSINGYTYVLPETPPVTDEEAS